MPALSTAVFPSTIVSFAVNSDNIRLNATNTSFPVDYILGDPATYIDISIHSSFNYTPPGTRGKSLFGLVNDHKRGV